MDEGSTPDTIERITIEYHKITKCASDEPAQETEEREYSETLCIDRKTGILGLVQSTDAARRISHQYECQSGVESLLDFLGETRLFFSKAGFSGEITGDLYPLRKIPSSLKREDTFLADPPRRVKIRFPHTQRDRIFHLVCHIEKFADPGRLDVYDLL